VTTETELPNNQDTGTRTSRQDTMSVLVRIGEKFQLESPKVNKAPGRRLPEGAATLVEAMTHNPGYQLRTGNKPDETGLQRDSSNKHDPTKSTR